MNQRYTLVLICLNPDRTDCSGLLYPQTGHVEHRNYRHDLNILHGLYGTRWGQYETLKWLDEDPDSVWCVVKTEENEDFLMLDKPNNFVKFRSGMVVANGTKEECENHIWICIPEKEMKRKAQLALA